MLPSSFANYSFPTHSSFLKVVAFLCLFAACAVGCHRGRQKRLTRKRSTAITREFVFAANSAAPRGSEVHGEVGALDKVANSSDLWRCTFLSSATGRPPAVVKRLIDELNGIATARV